MCEMGEVRVVLTAWKAHGRYGYVNVELRNPEYKSERTRVLTYGKGFEMGAFFHGKDVRNEKPLLELVVSTSSFELSFSVLIFSAQRNRVGEIGRESMLDTRPCISIVIYTAPYAASACKIMSHACPFSTHNRQQAL